MKFVIKPILVRVCGESVFGLNYNNSLSLWNFDEYFLKCRVWTSAHRRYDEGGAEGNTTPCSFLSPDRRKRDIGAAVSRGDRM
jgi:hypothetical protein